MDGRRKIPKRRSARLANPGSPRKPTPPPQTSNKTRKYTKRTGSPSGSGDGPSPSKRPSTTVKSSDPQPTLREVVYGMMTGQISENPEVVVLKCPLKAEKKDVPAEAPKNPEPTRRPYTRRNVPNPRPDRGPEEVADLLKKVVDATHGTYYTTSLPDLNSNKYGDKRLEVARWVKTNAKSLDKMNVAAEKCSFATRVDLPREIQRVQREAEDFELYAQHLHQKNMKGDKTGRKGKTDQPNAHPCDVYGIHHLASKKEADSLFLHDLTNEAIEPTHDCHMVEFLRQALLRMESQVKLQWSTLNQYKKEAEEKDKTLKLREKVIQDLAFRIRVAEGETAENTVTEVGGVPVFYGHFSVPYTQALVENGVKQRERLRKVMKICFPNSHGKDLRLLVTDSFPDVFNDKK